MTAIETKKLKLNSIKNKKPQLKSSKKGTIIGKTVSKESKKNKNHTIEVSSDINIKVSKKKRHKKPAKDDIGDNNEEVESTTTTTEINNVEKSTKHKKIKKKKQKNVTSSNSDSKEIFEENISEETVEKTKKRKKRKSAESDKEMSEENISEETVEKPKKRKKRKLTESDIVDDDDTDNEESPPKKRKKKVKKEDKQESEDPEIKARTVFVGNVPIKCTKKEVKKHFRKYGIIESLRIRGIPPANPKVSKKVAAIKQEFHPERNNFLCYIRYYTFYLNLKSVTNSSFRYVNKEDALKAEAENGALFQGHHIRVHCCQSQAKPDESKAIFIGNLSFGKILKYFLWSIP